VKSIAIVGCGFSGAVIARELAASGNYRVDLFDERPHIGGNCHTEREAQSGIMQHVYGPHIFHTSDERVWAYVQQFGKWQPFVNRVKAFTKSGLFTLPINLLTINQFFGKRFSPSEAEAFLKQIGDSSIQTPKTFEEQALKMIGRDLYEAFFKGYTEKQWGMPPSDLPASILKRLPVRFNYNDNYYASKYQAIPEDGYSCIISNILDHKGIRIYLNRKVEGQKLKKDYDHLFYSGPLDEYFNHLHGHLRYRTLDFETKMKNGDAQGTAVINYCEANTPWTRITEHKHFAPWEHHEKTLVTHEYSRFSEQGDIPYYPIRLDHDKTLLDMYTSLAEHEEGVTFVGRLGTYRYLDMHIVITEALNAAANYRSQSEALSYRPPLTSMPHI
jgi:UDP-galactopyranose mutase